MSFKKMTIFALAVTLAAPICARAVLLLRLYPTCCGAEPTSSNGEKKEVDRKQSPVVLIELPKREGRFTRYFVHDASLIAKNVMGCGYPDELSKWILEGINADQETIRQFRLSDGRHVVAIYDDTFCYSLLLIYKTTERKSGKEGGGTGDTGDPLEQLKSIGAAAASGKGAVDTKDGSLEAWLLRHGGHDYAEHFLPLEQWKRFLEKAPNERARESNALPLEGSIQAVSEDRFGLVQLMSGIDLHSLQPLPAYTALVDFRVKAAKEAYEREALKHGDRVVALKEEYEFALKESEFYHSHKCKNVATIQGDVLGGWGRPATDRPFLLP